MRRAIRSRGPRWASTSEGTRSVLDSVVTAEWLTDRGPDGERYRETVKRLYNKVVFENDSNGRLGQPSQPPEDPPSVEVAARQQALGEVYTIWASWENTPKELSALKGDKAALKKRIEDHIREEVSALKGQIDEWDVINEPCTNRDIIDLLGKDVMIDWFKIAHQADPAPKLFVNDYGVLNMEGGFTARQNHYEEIIQFLIQKGAPLDGIGEQVIFMTDLTAPDRLFQILDRFQALGKTIEITEHDIDIPDIALQASYTRDFLTAIFSHPSVSGFLSWGFSEGSHWRPQGAYFRKNWSIKPAGQVLTDLITKEWWTEVNAESDPGGVYKLRGFLGDYEIVAQDQGKKAAALATLTAKGTTIRLTLR